MSDQNMQLNAVDVDVQLRELKALRWNSKVFGHYLASCHYDPESIRSIAPAPGEFQLAWQAPKFQDFRRAWFLDACQKLKVAPILHRKVWEEAYVLKCLESTGLLHPGSRGLGFGCGEEPFGSVFADRGVEVVVTDLDPGSQAANGWVKSRQHASNIETIYRPTLVSREKFDSLVTFEYLDMNRIPMDLAGQFDFCWSVCALEHLGSIQLGSQFVENSLAVLKPGGFAVHTTEFNYGSDAETIESGGTVLFRKKDLEALAQRVRDLGYRVFPVSFDLGSSPVDWFIDLPPYPGDPVLIDENLKALHLKLTIEGFPCTCFGMVMQRPDFDDGPGA